MHMTSPRSITYSEFNIFLVRLFTLSYTRALVRQGSIPLIKHLSCKSHYVTLSHSPLHMQHHADILSHSQLHMQHQTNSLVHTAACIKVTLT